MTNIQGKGIRKSVNLSYVEDILCYNESLRENCFPYLGRMRRDIPYLSVFSPNAGKYGPEKIPYLDTFHAVNSCSI